MSMKYIKIYLKIITNAKSEERVKSPSQYYEKHHIQPTALGGKNTKSNMVLLTAREHYICHMALYKHYKFIGKKMEMNKMAHAWKMMTIGQNGKRYVSHSFELARKASSKARIGCKHTTESRDKMSVAAKGRKKTQQHKVKIGVGNKGKVLSDTTKKKLSQSRIDSGVAKGKNNPFYGKTHSIETRNKIIESNKRRKQNRMNKLKEITKFLF